jgi:hypothetical protein
VIENGCLCNERRLLCLIIRETAGQCTWSSEFPATDVRIRNRRVSGSESQRYGSAMDLLNAIVRMLANSSPLQSRTCSPGDSLFLTLVHFCGGFSEVLYMTLSFSMRTNCLGRGRMTSDRPVSTFHDMDPPSGDALIQLFSFATPQARSGRDVPDPPQMCDALP